MLSIIEKTTGILLIGILVFNLSQRKHIKHGEKKRFASLFLSFYILSLFASIKIIERFLLPELSFPIFLLICTLPVVIYRKKLFLFKTNCSSCRKRLPIKHILYHDGNKCEACNDTEK